MLTTQGTNPSMSSAANGITPIAALNIHDGGWTIKARVTSRSNIRTWSNDNGEGSFFSIELRDAAATTIRGTFFREAVGAFYDQIQVGNVYIFSGGRLKNANTKFNTCSSTLEIIFDVNSTIRLNSEEPSSLSPKIERSKSTTPNEAHSYSNNVTPKRHGTSGTVINRGIWGKGEGHRNSLSYQGATTVTPTPDETPTPVYDKNLSDSQRQRLREDRAAAAEARLNETLRRKRPRSSRSKSPIRSPTFNLKWTLT